MDLATELLRTVNLAGLTALVDKHFGQTLVSRMKRRDDSASCP